MLEVSNIASRVICIKMTSCSLIPLYFSHYRNEVVSFIPNEVKKIYIKIQT